MNGESSYMRTSDGSNILVVDDIPANRRLLVKVLSTEGYQISEANDGVEALELVKSQPFDLVLTDINMPNMDGFELTRTIKTSPGLSHIPVILVTALTDQVSHMKGLDSGAEDLLSKPVNLLEAKTKVRNLLRLKHAIDELRNVNQFLSQYDSLTGLPNRASYHDQIPQLVRESDRDNEQLPLVLVMMGVHNYRKFANVLSHTQQEMLIKHVTERLKLLLPEDSTIFRFGESRFAVILKKVKNQEHLEAVLSGVQLGFNQPLDLETGKIHAGVSMGVSILNTDEPDHEALTRQADTALSNAVRRAESSFVVYTSNMDANAAERLVIENELRHALERNQFKVFYQPKLDLATGLPTSMEALIRWEHEGLGMIAPDVFIPIAEETGLILDIGEWVLKTACKQCLEWRKRFLPHMTVAVNLSARQFLAYNVREMVETTLRQTQLPTSGLELELTESCTMEDADYSKQVLSSLNRLGIGIAIDDFGTGFSSLSYLTQLPVTHLKIDRTFISELPDNRDAAAVASGIVALAHSLGLSVVAEGVETQEQLEFLRDRNCDIIQGYYISKPLAAEDYSRFLEEFLSQKAG